MKTNAVRRLCLFLAFYTFPIFLFFLSPVLPYEGLFHEGSGGIVVGALMVFAAQFIASLVLGRAFCGWACGGGALQEIAVTWINDKPARTGRSRWTKFFIWAPWLLGLVIGFVCVGGIKAWDFLFHSHFSLPLERWGELTIIYFAVSAAVILVAALTGRRGFCHHVCWMAPFMILGRHLGNALHLPGLRLFSQASACTGCRRCNDRCPMTLDVAAMAKSGHTEHHDCILCGNCAAHCAKKAVRLGWGKHGQKI